jgi:hypothetical protein
MTSFITHFKTEILSGVIAGFIISIPFYFLHKSDVTLEYDIFILCILIFFSGFFVGFNFIIGWKKLSFLKFRYIDSRTYNPYERKNYSINPIGLLYLVLFMIRISISFYMGLLFLPVELYNYFKK